MKNKSLKFIILFIILAAGVYLRFANLSQKGIFSWDEGHYAGVLYTLGAAIKYIIKTFLLKEHLGAFSEYILRHGVMYHFSGKPTFFVLGLAGAVFIGLHIYTLQFVSAALGLLTAAVVYLTARIITTHRAAVVAGAALATSYFHIHYSRAALPHVSSVFLAYLAVLLYVYSVYANKKYLFLSGFTIGLAFTCHYNLFWLPFIFLACEIIMKSKMRRLVAFSFFMALPLLFYEGLTRLAKMFIYSHPAWVKAMAGSSGQGQFLAYFEQIKFQIWQSKYFSETVHNISEKFFCVNMFAVKESPVAIALFILGFFYIFSFIKTKKIVIGHLLVFSLFAVPLVLYSGSEHVQNMRSVAVILPAFALIAGAGFAFLEQFIAAGKKEALVWPAVLAVSLLLVINAFRLSGEYINQKSGYNAAVEFMRSNEGLKHFSSNPLIMRIYAGRQNAYDIRAYYPPDASKDNKDHFSLDQVIRLHKEGFNYFVLDHLRYRYDNILVTCAETVPAVFSAPHSSEADMFEQGYSGLSRAKMSPKRVDVYRIEDLLKCAGKGK